MTFLPSPPAVSRGYASLTPAARRAGEAAGRAAAAALARVVGAEVRIAGRCLAAPAAALSGTATAWLALQGAGATASLEVDAGLLARTVARLGGARPASPAALAATPVEQCVLELLTLVALEAAVEPLGPLAPRLALDPATGPAGDALVVALDLAVGEDGGAGRITVPAAAVATLGAPELTAAAAGVAVAASLLRGSATLAPDDLAALAPGDVVLLDEGTPRAELVLPGGLRLLGAEDGDHFQVEEIRMTETQADYPITLSVELGRVTVTLGELARLEPGAAIALGLPRSGPVVLRAGERSVARGELILVDGALGVRVAQVGDAW